MRQVEGNKLYMLYCAETVKYLVPFILLMIVKIKQDKLLYVLSHSTVNRSVNKLHNYQFRFKSPFKYPLNITCIFTSTYSANVDTVEWHSRLFSSSHFVFFCHRCCIAREMSFNYIGFVQGLDIVQSDNVISLK